MELIFQYGLQGIVAYGAVGLVSMVAKRKNLELDGSTKMYILVTVAFLVGFVPADLGNFLLNHIKDAVTIAFAINSFNTVVNKVGGVK